MEAVSLSSGPERFIPLREVWLFGVEGVAGEGQPAGLESVWEHNGRLVFKFAGIDSIAAAERLEGAEVRIPREQRAPLPADEYYQSDLVGCEVIERQTGERLGVVEGWAEAGGPPLLEIETGGSGPMLIPFARSICVEIDVPGRRILVDLPEGLKELNG